MHKLNICVGNNALRKWEQNNEETQTKRKLEKQMREKVVITSITVRGEQHHSP